jgi:hypothetical protein
MLGKLAIVILAGALAAACSHTETRTVVVPAPTDDSCAFYGYQPGTQSYAICVEREAAARRLPGCLHVLRPDAGHADL